MQTLKVNIKDFKEEDFLLFPEALDKVLATGGQLVRVYVLSDTSAILFTRWTVVSEQR